MSKLRLSFSKMDKWMGCQGQYYYCYVDKQPFILSKQLVLGSTWHLAIEKTLKNKMKYGECSDINSLNEYFSDTFDTKTKNCTYIFNDIDTKDALLDSGLRMLKLYCENIAPTVNPIGIEERYTMSTHHADIVGIIDLIDQQDDGIAICDNKSFGKIKSQAVLDNPLSGYGLQGSIYSLLFRLNNNRKELGFRWDAAVTDGCNNKKHKNNPFKKDLIYKKEVPEDKEKRPMAIIQMATTRTDEDLHDVLDLIDDIAKDIIFAHSNNIFIPNRDYMFCDEKWCSYWDKCHKDFDKKKIKELTNDMF